VNTQHLPAPAIDWDPVYELLRCLGEASDDPNDRAFQAVSLIAGMQANEPIDQWLLQELLSLAQLPVEDPASLRAISAPIGVLQGAGLLNVEWAIGSPLHLAATSSSDLSFGSENRGMFRRRVVDQMERVEAGLRLAFEALEASEEDDTEDWI